MADKPLPFEAPEPPRQTKQDSSLASMNELAMQISATSRRLRVLEERYTNLHKKNQLTDQSVLNLTKEFTREIKAQGQDMLDLKRELEDMKDKMKLAINELQDCAKIEDVQIIRKYVDLFDFVKFTTPKDVERIVEEKLSELIPAQKAMR